MQQNDSELGEKEMKKYGLVYIKEASVSRNARWERPEL
jgi:hypothetical protein